MTRHDPGSLDAAVGAGRLFAAAPEALLVVFDGVVTQANERALELVGNDPTGGSTDELLPAWATHARADANFEDGFAREAGSQPLPVEVLVRELGPGVALASIRRGKCRSADLEA